MTDYKMTDEMRKRLTEFLGEKREPPYEYRCYGKIRDSNETNNCHIFGGGERFFDNDDDMLVVFRKIRDVGKWSEFYRFTGKHWLKDDDAWEREEPLEVWLFMGSYERACCLAADFLEEQG